MPQAPIITLSFSLEKFSSSQLRGCEYEPREPGDERGSAGAPGAEARAQRRNRRHRRSEQRKNMRCVAVERCGHLPPALRIGRILRGNAAGGRLEVGFDAEPGAVGKRGGKASRGRNEFNTRLQQPILVGGKKRRAGEQAEIHRVEVVAEARQRDLGGFDRAACDHRALKDRDLPALGGEMHGGGKPVDPRADDDRVVPHTPYCGSTLADTSSLNKFSQPERRRCSPCCAFRVVVSLRSPLRTRKRRDQRR
jgi:hypothetical protein